MAELPVSVLAAWGVKEPGARGPRAGLALGGILDAGIAVAARDGLGAVSMARVAQEAGASTMALYRHVGSKDELLELMVDRALGPPPPRPPRERGWRSGLTRWATGVRRAYLTHPWALRIPITGAPLGPNNVRWLESGLDALRTTGLTSAEQVSTVLLLSGFVRNNAVLTADITAAARADVGTGTAPPDYGAALVTLTDAREFPHVHAAIEAGVFSDDDRSFEQDEGMDAEFEFGLARVLDGVGVLVERRSRRPSSR